MTGTTYEKRLRTRGKDGFYCRYVKRVLDIALSLIGLAVCLIPMMVIYLAILANMGGPVLFKQQRIGRGEKHFAMYKFRSMRTAFDEYGVPLPDEVRMTGLGHFLRATSLDELPSLINIIKGDMSIVGPRPLPVNYQPWFTPEERKRHEIRGGLTGYAQVHGRNTSSWEQRFAYDLEYVDNVSFALDVQIVCQTVGMVLGRRDIGARNVDAPPDFHVLRSGLSERELVQAESRRDT